LYEEVCSDDYAAFTRLKNTLSTVNGHMFPHPLINCIDCKNNLTNKMGSCYLLFIYLCKSLS